jgi:hypothetical protein
MQAMGPAVGAVPAVLAVAPATYEVAARCGSHPGPVGAGEAPEPELLLQAEAMAPRSAPATTKALSTRWMVIGWTI